MSLSIKMFDNNNNKCHMIHWLNRLILIQSTLYLPKCTPRDWEFGTVHLENNAKWCIYGVVTHAHVIYYYPHILNTFLLIVYWNIDLCLFAFGALTSVESRSSFFWRIRDTVDSLTLTFHLFLIQLTYSIRSLEYGEHTDKIHTFGHLSKWSLFLEARQLIYWYYYVHIQLFKIHSNMTPIH